MITWTPFGRQSLLSQKDGPVMVQWDQIQQPQTVRGDHLRWGTIHSMTGQIHIIFLTHILMLLYGNNYYANTIGYTIGGCFMVNWNKG